MDVREKLCLTLGHQQLALIELEAELERLRHEVEALKPPAEEDKPDGTD